MNTHKVNGTLTHSPVAKDDAERNARYARAKEGAGPGINPDDVRTFSPGERINPKELGMSDAEIKSLEERRVILPLEGLDESHPTLALANPTADNSTLGIRATGGENRTEGSGATGLGTRSEGPPGVPSATRPAGPGESATPQPNAAPSAAPVKK